MPLTREININQVVFGLPTVYANGNILSPGSAANVSARTLDAVKLLTYMEFRNSPYLPNDNTVVAYFNEQLHLAMTAQGGTAGKTGSGSSNIIFRDEERSFFNPLNCK